MNTDSTYYKEFWDGLWGDQEKIPQVNNSLVDLFDILLSKRFQPASSLWFRFDGD